jgi:glutaminyl-tRNA synthetase
MASPNLNMRDPVIYRILRSTHHRTGDKWCIYPMYDYAHPLSDAVEDITHSVCTLEFSDHRPLYDWCLDNVDYDAAAHGRPQQIEFARLNLNYTVMSKRKLRELVEKGYVNGWDDPRMPTISGLRRRGYTPEAIRDFCTRIGVAKRDSMVDIALLEHCVREDLNLNATRVMAVLRPLKVIIDNYPEGQVEWLEAENNPENPEMGFRKIPFAREIYIEQEDFMENPPKKFFRLTPGGEIRLKSAYIIKCEEVVKDANGEIIELHCSYDPESKSGGATSGRKIKGTSHWVSVAHAIPAEVRLYEHLFLTENPDDEEDGKDYKSKLNPNSLEVLSDCRVEPGLAEAAASNRYQFLRQGYFCPDPDSSSEKLVFNRVVSLRDSWAKAQKS